MFGGEAGMSEPGGGVVCEQPLSSASGVREPAQRPMDRLAQGVVWHGAATAVVMGLGLATSIYLNRALGTDGYGTLVLALAVPNILSALVHLGSRTSLARFLPFAVQQGDTARAAAVVRASWWLHVVGLGVFGAAWWWAASWLAGSYYQRPELLALLRLGVWYLAGVAVSEWVVQIFQSLQRWGRSSVLECLQPWLYLGLAVVAVRLGAGVAGVIVANVASLVIAAGLGVAWLSVIRRRWSVSSGATAAGAAQTLRASMVESWRFGAPVLVSYAGLYIFQWFDKAMLGRYVSVSDLAFYAIAGMFLNVWVAAFKVFYNVALPQVAGLKPDEPEVIARQFRLVFRWFGHAALLGALAAGCLVGPVARWCYGNGYGDVARYFQALVVFGVLRVSTNPAGLFLVNVFNRTRPAAAIALAVTVLDVALMGWWVPRWGVWGAIAAAGTAYVAYWPLLLAIVPPMRRLVPWGAAGRMGLGAGVALGVGAVAAAWPWWVQVPAVCGAYLAVQLLLREVEPRDRALLKDLIGGVGAMFGRPAVAR